MTTGLVLIAASAVVFLIGGLVLGWGTAFEVLAGYRAPSETCGGGAAVCTHRMAFVLGVLGYLVVPAIIGTVAALLVDLGVRRYTIERNRLAEEFLKRFRDR